jgi:hypothetical protein
MRAKEFIREAVGLPAPSQDQLRAQIRANKDQALKTSSLANLRFRDDSKPATDISLDKMIGQYAAPGVPKPVIKPVGAQQQTTQQPGQSTTQQTTQQTGQSTPQQTAKSTLAAKDKTAATDVDVKVPGQSVNTTQKAQTAAQVAAAQKLSPGIMRSAPTLGAPAATQAAPSGFLGGLAQGFKKGMGIDPDASMAQTLAAKGLSSLGMKNSSAAASGGVNPQAYVNQVLNSQPKAGQTIKDPITGKGSIKVLPNPGGKGIKLDTTKTLGYPIIVDPKDLA